MRKERTTESLHNLRCSQSKQKVSCRETWDLAEFLKVVNIIGDDDFASDCYGALVLQQIFKVTNRAIEHSFDELICINRNHFNRIGEVLEDFVNLVFWVMAKQVTHCSEGHCCSTRLNLSCTAKIEDGIGFSAELSILNGIHQDVCIKIDLFHSLIHFVKIEKVRASISLAVKFNFMACKRCASVRLSHAFCLSQVGAFLACPRNLFVPCDSGTLYIFRISSTNELVDSDVLVHNFNSAILRAKKSSSSWRLADSTSRMASCIYSTTAWNTLTSVPFSKSKMGAKADSWIILVAAVITRQYYSYRCKVTTII